MEKTAIAHRACFTDPDPGSGAARSEGPRARRTRARHMAVHALPAQGASHGQIMRRPRLSRNTVKKHAAAKRAEQLIHGPKYSTTLVDPSRDHLRRRRAQEPTIITWTLLQEKQWEGGSTLLCCYPDQGCADDQHPPPSPVAWPSGSPPTPPASPTTQIRLEHALSDIAPMEAALDSWR